MSRAFRFLTHNDLALLEEKSERLLFEPEKVILREGTVTQALLIIRSGSVRVEKDCQGEAVLVDRLGGGECLGVISFLDRSPVAVSVVASEPTEVDYIDGIAMHSLLSSVPGLAARFYQSLASLMSARLRETMEKMLSPFYG